MTEELKLPSPSQALPIRVTENTHTCTPDLSDVDKEKAANMFVDISDPRASSGSSHSPLFPEKVTKEGIDSTFEVKNPRERIDSFVSEATDVCDKMDEFTKPWNIHRDMYYKVIDESRRSTEALREFAAKLEASLNLKAKVNRLIREFEILEQMAADAVRKLNKWIAREKKFTLKKIESRLTNPGDMEKHWPVIYQILRRHREALKHQAGQVLGLQKQQTLVEETYKVLTEEVTYLQREHNKQSPEKGLEKVKGICKKVALTFVGIGVSALVFAASHVYAGFTVAYGIYVFCGSTASAALALGFRDHNLVGLEEHRLFTEVYENMIDRLGQVSERMSDFRSNSGQVVRDLKECRRIAKDLVQQADNLRKSSHSDDLVDLFIHSWGETTEALTQLQDSSCAWAEVLKRDPIQLTEGAQHMKDIIFRDKRLAIYKNHFENSGDKCSTYSAD